MSSCFSKEKRIKKNEKKKLYKEKSVEEIVAQKYIAGHATKEELLEVVVRKFTDMRMNDK